VYSHRQIKEYKAIFFYQKETILLTNKEIKLLQALDKKSERYIQGRFVVEGIKNVEEVMRSNFNVLKIYATDDRFCEHPFYEKVGTKELERISHLKNAAAVLAVIELPDYGAPDLTKSALVLDGINDPGNLGTIIRTADWFGIDQIICSPNSVDVFNPKVVMSSMGSISRVKVFYTELLPILKQSSLDSYAADLSGNDVRTIDFNKPSLIVLGSESQGISAPILAACTHKVTIIGFGQAESLNVGVATGILLHEFNR
jgi:TrmH family RNA methyltransferase